MSENREKNNQKNATEEVKNTSPVEIIGINFREAGKIYYFAPGKYKFTQGDKVIVETSRGVELGTVKIKTRPYPSPR